MLIFPDVFTWPVAVSTPDTALINLAKLSDKNYTWSTVPSYNLDEFSALEEAGCVFLPNAGYRSTTTMNSVNMAGYYWTATKNGNSYAYDLAITEGGVNSNGGSMTRNAGCAVRLVQTYSQGR